MPTISLISSFSYTLQNLRYLTFCEVFLKYVRIAADQAMYLLPLPVIFFKSKLQNYISTRKYVGTYI